MSAQHESSELAGQSYLWRGLKLGELSIAEWIGWRLVQAGAWLYSRGGCDECETTAPGGLFVHIEPGHRRG